MARKKYLYMAVTRDEIELPVCVADSAAELARRMGVKTNTVHAGICRYEKHRYKGIYRRIPIEDAGGGRTT